MVKEFDYSKLKGRIIEKYGNRYSFSKDLGMSTVSLSKRLNNHIAFGNDEMARICSLLDINLDDGSVKEYFFKTNV